MGAYLSQPVTTTEPSDGQSDSLAFGASSMQGWRTSQEDAHLSLLDYDQIAGEKVSLFGVFDGHGGAEVAEYTARHLPAFIKGIPHYQNGDFEPALRESFLQFDRHLVEPNVLVTLKAMAGTIEESDTDDISGINEAIKLREEADIPIDELRAKYAGDADADADDKKLLSAVPPHLRQEIKPKSPYLRAKTNKQSSEADEIGVISGMCSSSQDSGPSSQSNNNGVGSSSSDSLSQHPPSAAANGEHDDIGSTSSSNVQAGEERQDSDISSSTSTGNQSVKKEINEEDSGESLSPKASENGITTSSENKVTSPSTPKKEANDKTSSQSNGAHAKSDHIAEAGGNADSTNSASENSGSGVTTSLPETPASTKPDKGKRKKVIDKEALAEKERQRRDVAEGPVYEKFLRDFDASEDEAEDEEDDFSGDSESGDDEEIDDSEDLDEEESDEEDSDIEDGVHPGAMYGGDMEEPGKDSGCTAVVALLRGSELFVANAGDSRCVVCRDGQAVEMSVDHKPEDDLERTRIENAGGQVTADGRVNGGLNLSRALGDHAYKENASLPLQDQMISPLPDIRKLTVGPTDEFMVLACDGIWNSLTSQQVVDFVRPRLAAGKKSLSAICEDLFHECLAPNTMGDGTGCDNMTCIIVTFGGNANLKRKSSTETELVDTSEQPSSKRVRVDNEASV